MRTLLKNTSQPTPETDSARANASTPRCLRLSGIYFGRKIRPLRESSGARDARGEGMYIVSIPKYACVAYVTHENIEIPYREARGTPRPPAGWAALAAAAGGRASSPCTALSRP